MTHSPIVSHIWSLRFARLNFGVAAVVAAAALTAFVPAVAGGDTYPFATPAQQSRVTPPADGAKPLPADSFYPWPVWSPTPAAHVSPSRYERTYYVNGRLGKDSNDGGAPDSAFATVAKAVSMVHAGDTVLISPGLYHEGIVLMNAPSGAPDKVTTFANYGDGEVILDGSQPVSGWRKVNGSVWKAPISFHPIAVVVDERPLRQVAQGQRGSTAPIEGIAGVTPGSGKWAFDSNAKEIYADFGPSDPSGADVVVPNDNGGQYHVYFWGGSYITFDGLTIRGSGSNGVWGYSNHITVINCNIKYNGKAGVSFMGGTDNAVITSHIYQNVMLNWPRGNNGFAESGGGWAGAVVWGGNVNGYGRGNVVHANGGEGMLSYGTAAGKPSGGTLLEQNVVFDNWSVNIYLDNQPNNIVRNNFIYDHAIDPQSYLYLNANHHPYDLYGRYRVGIMLADEQGSSDDTNDHANLTHTTVENNIVVNCAIGIRDYSEGVAAMLHHGLKDTLIANNTIILPPATASEAAPVGMLLQDNGSEMHSRNSNSYILNNLIVAIDGGHLFDSRANGAISGVIIDHNLYFSHDQRAFRIGATSLKDVDFSAWRQSGQDTHGAFADPDLRSLGDFDASNRHPYRYTSAMPKDHSPARTMGLPQSGFESNFAGQARSHSAWGVGAL